MTKNFQIIHSKILKFLKSFTCVLNLAESCQIGHAVGLIYAHIRKIAFDDGFRGAKLWRVIQHTKSFQNSFDKLVIIITYESQSHYEKLSAITFHNDY